MDGEAGGQGGVVGVACAEQGHPGQEGGGEEVATPALVGGMGGIVVEKVGGREGGGQRWGAAYRY